MDDKQIKNITADGLWYVDETGNDLFIDFSACYGNYLQMVTSPEYFERMKELNPQSKWDEESIQKYIKRRTAWREVAKRNILGPPWADGPYIEFHTEPPTRFDFSSEDEFRNARYEIERYGWGTA